MGFRKNIILVDSVLWVESQKIWPSKTLGISKYQLLWMLLTLMSKSHSLTVTGKVLVASTASLFLCDSYL